MFPIVKEYVNPSNTFATSFASMGMLSMPPIVEQGAKMPPLGAGEVESIPAVLGQLAQSGRAILRLSVQLQPFPKVGRIRLGNRGAVHMLLRAISEVKQMTKGAARVWPPRSYQEIDDCIDKERMRRLGSYAPVEPVDQSPSRVRGSSRFGIYDPVVWEEVGPEQDRYLRPNSKYNVFTWITAPEWAVQYRAGTIDVRQPLANQVVIVPPYTAAYFCESGFSHCLHVSVSQELLVRANGNLYSDADPRIRLRNTFGSPDPVVGSLCRALWREPTDAKLPACSFVQCIGTAIAIHLLSKYAEKETPAKGLLSPTQLSILNDYLQCHLADKIAIEDVARLLSMTQYQFSRMFQATVGVPPLRYVLQLRMGRARTLIESTTRPIGEIAADLGYFDISHFSNLFRKFWGMPPSKFRHVRFARIDAEASLMGLQQSGRRTAVLGERNSVFISTES
jgi:AraC family transcriptional regulator